MTTLAIPVRDAAVHPTRIEAMLLAFAATVERAIARRMLHRAETALPRARADAHAEATRDAALRHLARHPFG
jgi:hypothetical protein